MRTLAIAVLLLSLVLPLASAHVTQAAGPYTIKIGWNSEPPASGSRNLVTMQVWQTSNMQGVTGLEQTLKMSVVLGDSRKDLMFTESDEAPGNYSAPILPTQPGLYVVHIEGSIQGLGVNQDFHIEEVSDGSQDAFPSTAGQPTTQELQTEIQQLQNQIDQLRTQPKGVPGLGVEAAVLGLAGAAILLALARRR